MFKLTFIINVSFNNQLCLRLDDRLRVPALRAPLLLLPAAYFSLRAPVTSSISCPSEHPAPIGVNAAFRCMSAGLCPHRSQIAS